MQGEVQREQYQGWMFERLSHPLADNIAGLKKASFLQHFSKVAK